MEILEKNKHDITIIRYHRLCPIHLTRRHLWMVHKPIKVCLMLNKNVETKVVSL